MLPVPVAQTDDVMSAHSSSNWPFVFNLANSIIGVAVLALPFCFKEVPFSACLGTALYAINVRLKK